MGVCWLNLAQASALVTGQATSQGPALLRIDCSNRCQQGSQLPSTTTATQSQVPFILRSARRMAKLTTSKSHDTRPGRHCLQKDCNDRPVRQPVTAGEPQGVGSCDGAQSVGGCRRRRAAGTTDKPTSRWPSMDR